MSNDIIQLIKVGSFLLSLYPFCYWLFNHDYKLFVAADDYDEIMNDHESSTLIRNKLITFYSIIYSIPAILFSLLLFTMIMWICSDTIVNLYGLGSFVVLVLSCIFCFSYNNYYCYISKDPQIDNDDE